MFKKILFIILLKSLLWIKAKCMSDSCVVKPILCDNRLSRHSAEDKFLWPNKTVHYKINENVSSNVSVMIYKFLKKISDKSCVKFKNVTRDDNSVLNIILGNSFASTYGYCPSSGQHFMFVTSNPKEWILLHSIMHVLGFFHEHIRPDRDDFITILWENIEKDKFSEFFRVAPEGLDYFVVCDENNDIETFDYCYMKYYGKILTPYDHTSILHFDPYTGSKNGRQTMKMKNSSVNLDTVGYSKYFLDREMAKVNLHYKCDTYEDEDMEIN